MKGPPELRDASELHLLDVAGEHETLRHGSEEDTVQAERLQLGECRNVIEELWCGVRSTDDLEVGDVRPEPASGLDDPRGNGLSVCGDIDFDGIYHF